MDSPSTTQVGHCKDTSKVLHEDDPAGAEVRSDGDVEAAIAVEQSGVASIQFNALETKDN